MLTTKQTTPRRWLMGLISAFFYPLSEAEVRTAIKASQEERRSAEEVIGQAQAFIWKVEEKPQMLTVKPGKAGQARLG